MSSKSIQVQLSSQFSEGVHLSADLNILQDGICGIFGDSGAGKTTLLRCISGLERVPNCFISLSGEIWQSDEVFVPTHKRALAYVMQENNLFPHLTVMQNITYALKRRISDFDSNFWKSSFASRVVEMMAIDGLLNRSVEGLSGGEKQRIALARALLSKPKLVLLDEPLSALDDSRKEEILPYLEKLKALSDTCILYVTHSKQELARLADRVVLVDNGSFKLFEDIPSALLPAKGAKHKEVLIEAIVDSKIEQWNMQRLLFAGQHIQLKNSGEKIGTVVRLCVSSKDVSLSLSKPVQTSVLNLLSGTIEAIELMEDGFHVDILLDIGGSKLWATVSSYSVSQMGLSQGVSVWAQIKAAALIA